MSISEFFKESLIKIARHTLGEAKTHDYLIRRGIQLRGFNRYYQNGDLKVDSSQQTLIFMADGKWMHGGLTDRIRGMVSAWDFAKSHGLDFKIFHISPFPLENILKPNQVDWTIREKELCWNSNEAKPVLLYRKDFENVHALERQLDSSHKQFHLYSCIDSVSDKFSQLFNELFAPSEILQTELHKYDSLLEKPFGAISFRMQNLLGDFAEGKFGTLKESQKETLLNAALNTLDKVLEENFQWENFLVTADSPTLLAEAAKRSRVVTVSGKSIHIDFNKSEEENDYLKAFVEFLLISKAQKAFLYINRKFKTYPSNFPKYAAKLGGVPFEVIKE